MAAAAVAVGSGAPGTDSIEEEAGPQQGEEELILEVVEGVLLVLLMKAKAEELALKMPGEEVVVPEALRWRPSEEVETAPRVPYLRQKMKMASWTSAERGVSSLQAEAASSQVVAVSRAPCSVRAC